MGSRTIRQFSSHWFWLHEVPSGWGPAFKFVSMTIFCSGWDLLPSTPTQLLFRMGSSLVLGLRKSEFFFSQIIYFPRILSPPQVIVQSLFLLDTWYQTASHRETPFWIGLWHLKRSHPTKQTDKQTDTSIFIYIYYWFGVQLIVFGAKTKCFCLLGVDHGPDRRVLEVSEAHEQACPGQDQHKRNQIEQDCFVSASTYHIGDQ